MIKTFLLVLLIALASGLQSGACQVCGKIKKCDSSLFGDYNIDPIFNSIASQLSLSDYPLSLDKSQSNSQITYTFCWPNHTYLATVDLATRAFKVIEATQSKIVESAQSSLGIRTEGLVATDSDLVTRIDGDIRKKYFSGENVKCVSIKPVQGGYHAVYQKSDGSTVSIDSTVKTVGNNVLVSYQICKQSNYSSSTPNSQIFVQKSESSVTQQYGPVKQNTANPSPTQTVKITTSPVLSVAPTLTLSVTPVLSSLSLNSATTSQASSTASSSSSSSCSSSTTAGPSSSSSSLTSAPSTVASSSSATASSSTASSSTASSSAATAVNTTVSTSSQQTLAGGYQSISATSSQVQTVLNFVTSQIGAIVGKASLISVQRQLVSGYNYKITLSFDSSSIVNYVIIVYQPLPLSSPPSITSLQMINVPSNYSFGSALTSAQASSLPYANSLVNAVSSQLNSTLTAGLTLDALYATYPYFKLVFHSNAYQQLVFVVMYDVLRNNASILNQSATPIPPQPSPVSSPVQPAPAQTQSNIVGGYQQISQPLSDQNVQNVLSYLIQSLGSIIKSGTLISAEKQVVNGFNYRLTLSFDCNSKAQYVIVVYQPINGTPSITAMQMINVPNSYSFGAALTSSQASALPYINSLVSAVSAQFNSSLTAGLVLDAIYNSYPYFSLVYHSTAYQKISVVVFYDILRNNASILNQTATPNPVQTQPSNDSQYQPIDSSLKQQSFIFDYISYLNTVDSQCSNSTLSGIYWKVSDHNSLRYTFSFSNGSNKQISSSIDYIQYTLSHAKSQASKKVPNCLVQSGSQCTKCQFKYYLNNGACSPVQIQCSDFNYDTNICQGCYSGYYLDLKAICQRANYLCQSSDRKGNCLTCFNDYRLTYLGRCIYIAVGANESCPEQQNNPLCSKFNQATCLSCVRGCYQNAAGLCKIPDPNCDDFDQVTEICKVCMQNYSLSQTSRSCVPNSNYN